MKATKNIKRLGILAILLLSTFTISANPLSYILGTDATGLDITYILMGISGISILLFYPDNSISNRTNHRPIKIKSTFDDDSSYHRKIVKKTP